MTKPVPKAQNCSAARAIAPALSLGMLLLSWAGLAVWLDDPSRAPAPWVVFSLIASEIYSGALLSHLGITLARVLVSFFFALLIGGTIGLVLGLRHRIDRFFDPWLIVALNIPALVTIVLSYLWLGLGETAAIVAVVANKVPLVAVIIRDGARVLDPELAEMAKIYRMPAHRRLRHVILPQLAPYFASAARSGLALIWKIVLVVEFLGRGSGMGFKIHLYFQMFDIPRVLAYALAFVFVMLVIEWGIMQPIERMAKRWRQP